MDSENKIILIQQAVENAASQLSQARRLLADLSHIPAGIDGAPTAQPAYEPQGQVIEGVFNGQNMVAADGKIYAVPANYVSKSKLVEGDLLKLTVRNDGSFIYKQTGPVERKRLVGILEQDQTTGDYTVMVDKRAYRVIMAAITYFKGLPGNEVVILTPLDGNSVWAAVENVIHAGSTTQHYLTSGADGELTSGTEAELTSGVEAELTTVTNESSVVS